MFYDFGEKKEHEKKPDQWKLRPQSTTEYIQKWREYNAKRVLYNPNLSLFEAASETQFTTIVRKEKAIHAKNVTDRNTHPVTKKVIHSSFHSKLRDETGDKHIAHCIWKIGMPEPSQWCHEITNSHELTEAVATGLADDANMILIWLYRVAHMILDSNLWRPTPT